MVLAWLGLLATSAASRPATASPIRGRLQAQRLLLRQRQIERVQAMAVRVVTPGTYWDRYFARALHSHRLNVRGPNALRVLALTASPDGSLPSSSFVAYLQWRRSLNTARFDYFHPQLGQLLNPGQIARVDTPATGGVTPPPPIQPPPPVIPPINPEVPEPSSAAVALLLLAAGAWARRHSSRTGSGE